MRDFTVLVRALETVENNLREHFSVADIARECYVSVSCLQKLFSYVFGYPVGEYMSKRRLSAAAHELVNTDNSVTDIALTYKYASPEVFSRAFKRFWGVLPSKYRKEHRFSELFPKLEIEFDKGGVFVQERRKIDITGLYDELKKLSGTYVLCADICGLKPINDTYGIAAGDLAIAETARRIDAAISDDMLMFRIGRDEFVAVTGFSSVSDAEALAQRIAALNGMPASYEGREIPVNVRIAISRIPCGDLSYKETLDVMYDTIEKIRQDGVYVGVLEE